jgi:hypothetical protein
MTEKEYQALYEHLKRHTRFCLGRKTDEATAAESGSSHQQKPPNLAVN